MATDDVTVKRDALIEQLNKYRDQVNSAFDEVEESLRKGEYARACEVMSLLSNSHAQTSINVRTTLIRNGFLSRERDNV